jgi:predicted MFS family arabinose efflux permease
LILANFTSGFGRIFSGFIADLIGPVNTLFVSFFLGGLFQVAMWPWSVHLGSIIAFALMEGFTGGWFMAVFPVAAAQLFGQQGLAAIVGFATLSTSPGQLAGASIAGVVLEKTGSYRAVAWYGGSMMLAGAAALSYGEKHARRLLVLRSRDCSTIADSCVGSSARLHGERRIFAKF